MKTLINKYKNLSTPLKASMWFIFCSFLQKGISLIVTPFFTRLLTTEEYGQYTLYNSWLGILTIFVTFKVTEAVFNKSMAKASDEEKEGVLKSYQLLLLVLWMVFFALYLVFRQWIDTAFGLPSRMIVVMFIEVFFTATINLWSAYQRYRYKYVLLVAITLLVSILNPTLGFVAVFHMSDRAFARVLGIAVSQGVVGTVLFFANLRGKQRVPMMQVWKFALLFNLPLIPHYLSQLLLNQADRIMISNMIGLTEAALYGVAYTIGTLATMITQSINNAYVPWLFEAMKAKKHSEIMKNNTLLMVVVAVVILCVIIVAPEGILLMGGANYAEATQVVYPVACSVYFMFMYSLYANIELYYETRKYVMIGTCASAILNLILNYIFLQIFGYVAAAYTTLFCYICYGVFHVVLSKRMLENRENVKLKSNSTLVYVIGLCLIVISFLMQMLEDFIVVRYAILAIIFIVAFVKRDALIKKYKEFSAR